MRLIGSVVVTLGLFGCNPRQILVNNEQPAVLTPLAPAHPILDGGVPNSNAETGAVDASSDQLEVALIRPSTTPVPSPNREARFLEFNDFSGVAGLAGDSWQCYRSNGTHYCYPSHLCSQLRTTGIDTGQSVTNCLPRDEVWCFAHTRGGHRTATCLASYGGCRSTRDLLVSFNTYHLYSNISRCRAFR